MEATAHITPGSRVRVQQQIRRQDRWLTTTVEGEVVSFARRPTGSWFAHGRNQRLWLDRLTIRTADGAESELVVDEHTEIETL